MAHSGIPLLGVHNVGAQIHRIVSKGLFDLLRRDVMASDVRYVGFVPVENQIVRHQY